MSRAHRQRRDVGYRGDLRIDRQRPLIPAVASETVKQPTPCLCRFRIEYEDALAKPLRQRLIEKGTLMTHVAPPRLGQSDTFGEFAKGDDAQVKAAFLDAADPLND